MNATVQVLQALLIGIIFIGAITILLHNLKKPSRSSAHRIPRMGDLDGSPNTRKAGFPENEDVAVAAAELTWSTVFQAEEEEVADQFLVVYVMARPPYKFTGYELLQTLLTVGFRFGKMGIFHYYAEQGQTGQALFSLAGATKPGTFDIDNMGGYALPGLCLFMSLTGNHDDLKTFNFLLETAKQLADELDGDLYDRYHQPLTHATVMPYYEQLTQLQAECV